MKINWAFFFMGVALGSLLVAAFQLGLALL